MVRHSERACLLPCLVTGCLGVAACVTRRGGLAWLSQPYELFAWASCFGGVGAQAALALAQPAQAPPPQPPPHAHPQHALLGLSAAAALAAIAGERLGTAAGRVLVVPLLAAGAASVVGASQAHSAVCKPSECAATVVQRAALFLIPAMQALCLPVHTLSGQGAFAASWFVLAAYMRGMEETPVVSPTAAHQLLLGAGTASVLRTLIMRRPLCQY